MDKFESITYVTENKVAYISLNSPQTMNAISQRMRHELKKVIDSSENNDEVRIVVIRAEGKGFSSGTDLSEGLAGFETIDDQIQQEYKPVLMGIAESSKPYIASIHGACAGIGASMAMTCDLAVMAEGAFLYLPFAGIGLVPDGGMSHHLVNAMGRKRAYQVFVESSRLQAGECLQYGLVNKVVSADVLSTETRKWAEHLAEGSPIAQSLGKEILRQMHQASYEQVFDMESKLQITCTTSEDHANAVRAFFEKRKAVFIGR